MANRRSTKTKDTGQVDVTNEEIEILKFVLFRKYNEDGLPEILISSMDKYKESQIKRINQSLVSKKYIECIERLREDGKFYQITSEGFKELINKKIINPEELLFDSNERIRSLAREYYNNT